MATIGQYLQPTRRNLPVAEFVEPRQFEEYREYGLALGFKAVFSGPLVRSSYMADLVSERSPARSRAELAARAGFGGAADSHLSRNSPIVWFAPVALTPLLVAMAREPRRRRRFLLGWSAGVVYWFGVCYWIQFVLAFHGGWETRRAGRVFLLFCVAKAMHMGVFGALAGMVMRRWWAAPSVAALWVARGSDARVARLRLAGAGECRDRHGRSHAPGALHRRVRTFVRVRPDVRGAGAGGDAAAARCNCSGWRRCLLLVAAAATARPRNAGAKRRVLLQPNISETEQWTAGERRSR